MNIVSISSFLIITKSDILDLLDNGAMILMTELMVYRSELLKDGFDKPCRPG